MRTALALLLLVAGAANSQDSGRWKLQYFYDVDKATFEIADLKFPSATRGIAVGAIIGENGVKPMSALTSDGGQNWTLVPLKEAGQSLFFLNDSLGWMVTVKGVWQTEESGRSWRKLKAPSGIIRVYFLDPDHGFAVGLRKQVFETKNGGSTWTKLAFPEEIKANPDYSYFTWIEFANKEAGMIGGASNPPRRARQRLPDWLDPKAASARRAWPHLTILGHTKDGGMTWKPSSASLFGEITTAKLSPEGWGLGLIQFTDSFEWSSEVMFLNWKSGQQKRIYRERNRRVTDVAIASPEGPMVLAGVENFGMLQMLPIPQKVKIVSSSDAEHWTEMPVDYRAVARRVILAPAGGENIWAATDTGMILKFTR